MSPTSAPPPGALLSSSGLARTDWTGSVLTVSSRLLQVKGFMGDDQLGEALEGSDVVIILAGVPRKPGMTRHDLFNINAGIIKGLCTAIAKHCPSILVKAVPIKQGHTLRILFPITPNILCYKEGPCKYISHLFGHEEEGSLFYVLKKLGWAMSLGAGEGDWSHEFSFFCVIQLTDVGREHMEDTLGLLFRYLKVLSGYLMSPLPASVTSPATRSSSVGRDNNSPAAAAQWEWDDEEVEGGDGKVQSSYCLGRRLGPCLLGRGDDGSMRPVRDLYAMLDEVNSEEAPLDLKVPETFDEFI